MPTREIPHNEWNAFFEIFSKQHEGWLATVEVLGPDIGAQEEAHELPLVGITADLKGSDADAISISVGKAAADHITHTITGAAHVRLEQAENGADEALQIESAGGATTLVRFRFAMLPELVDGIVSE
ncbi:MAG: DUF5335 family protein [Pyrinomonadaceae bacterium]